MGAGLSNLENSYGTVTATPRVIAFHSKDQWKAHFEASKETNETGKTTNYELVIDFTATWCGPCRFMEPAFKDFSAKYTDVDFIKIDVDELQAVAREYGVEAMPTFLLIKKGKVVDKVVGARKDELQKKIEKHKA